MFFNECKKLNINTTNIFNFYRLDKILTTWTQHHTNLVKCGVSYQKAIRKALKNVIISSELIQVHNNLRWYDYKYNEYSTINNLIPYRYDMICRNIESCRYQKIKRIDERIEKYLKLGNCYFLTLTFTDDVLDKTTKETRRRYIHYYLKSNCKHFIANIDYGDTTHREHYHAIIQCDHEISKWKYGFSNSQLIRTTEEDKKRLEKYITKLRNHTLKKSTKNERIIYSRER